jgi:hypothetical protein
MISLETDDHAAVFREVRITIDISELYAEIVEVCGASENEPGFVIVTSVKAIEPKSSGQQEIIADLRRVEP